MSDVMLTGWWVQPPPGGASSGEPYRKPNKAHLVGGLDGATWTSACEPRIALLTSGAIVDSDAPHCRRCEARTRKAVSDLP